MVLDNLNLWPTTLTYNPNLAKVKVDPYAKHQGPRYNGSAIQMDGHYQVNYLWVVISAAIIVWQHCCKRTCPRHLLESIIKQAYYIKSLWEITSRFWYRNCVKNVTFAAVDDFGSCRNRYVLSLNPPVFQLLLLLMCSLNIFSTSCLIWYSVCWALNQNSQHSER